MQISTLQNSGEYTGEQQYSYHLGVDSRGNPHFVDLTQLSNFNMSMVGMSGSGKTFGIRELLGNFWRSRITSVVLDTQGDLLFSEQYDGIPEEAFVQHEFHHERGNISFNPLQILASGMGGSYYAAVGRALKAIQFFHPSLGVKQKNVLREIIMRTYTQFGISRDDKSTWLKQCPTVVDLHRAIEAAIVDEETMLGNAEQDELHRLRKKLAKLRAGCETGQDLEDLKLSSNFTKELDKFKESLERYVDTIAYSGVNELQEKVDVKVLKSVEPIIKQMVHSRLYAETTNFRIAPGKINVLLMKEISPDERQAIFFLLLGSIFDYAQISCPELNPRIPSLMLVFDETKHFASVCEDPMSPFKRIITEGRKYGMGSLLGFQSPDQVAKDVLSNMSLSFVMTSARDSWASARAKYQIDTEVLAALEPKRDGLVAVNQEPFKLLRLWAFD